MSGAAPSPDTVMLSAHAVEQYQQRVKPGLELDTARAELDQLRALGQISAEQPRWVNAARPAHYYLLLGDAIVLPLAPQGEGWIAMTCVTPRTLTPTRRTAKSARRHRSAPANAPNAEPASDMSIAANTAGGHSTLELVLGTLILIWALAGASALLAWLSRLARRRRKQPGVAGLKQSWIRRLLRPAHAAADPGPTAPDQTGSTAAADEPSNNWHGDAAPSAAIPPDRAGQSRLPGSPTPPALPRARCSPETLEPLADSLDTSHRLAVAEARVADTLATLRSDRWLVERYVLIAGHRIPFLILGQTGVFTVWALTGPPIWDELPIPGHVATHVKQALPGYTGQIRVGICRPLAPAGIAPRWWCRPGQPGAWVMGLDWLIRWLEHFGTDHGLGIADLQTLRELAKPKPGPMPRLPGVVPDLG